jgi:hypothetical protein
MSQRVTVHSPEIILPISPYTSTMKSLYISNQDSRSLLSLNIDGRRTTALVTLSSQDLVVVVTKAHASLRPGVEVSLHVDGTAGALVAADGPVLVEGLDAIDGRLLVAGGHVDIVGVTVGVDGSLLLSILAGVVRTVVLDDVVLDERAPSPTVDGKVTVALRAERAAVVDGSAGTGVPSLATDKVTGVAPVDLVVAALTHTVLGVTTTVGPPRVEVAVVVAFTVAGDLTSLKDRGGVAVVTLLEEVKGASESPSESRGGNEEGFERDHGDESVVLDVREASCWLIEEG